MLHSAKVPAHTTISHATSLDLPTLALIAMISHMPELNLLLPLQILTVDKERTSELQSSRRKAEADLVQVDNKQ